MVYFFFKSPAPHQNLPFFPTRRSSDLETRLRHRLEREHRRLGVRPPFEAHAQRADARSEEHTSELQSHVNLVCRLLLEKKKIKDECSRLLEASTMKSRRGCAIKDLMNA